MAQNQSPALLVVALLLFAAATPPAQAERLRLSDLTVMGSLCCAKYGHCPGPPLPGSPAVCSNNTGSTALPHILAILVCTGTRRANVTVGRGSTGINGVFFIRATLKNAVLGSITGIVGGKLPCRVDVKLPLSDLICKDLSGTVGFLRGVPKITNAVRSRGKTIMAYAAVTMDSVSV